MKKYIFMAVAGMLALSSCSSDDNEQTPQNAPRQMTFTAGFGDGTQTRTTLNTADKSVEFDSGDAISIFSENNTNAEFTTTAGGATAEFTGTAVAGDATYYAVYPYNDSYTFSNGIVSGVTIEENQTVNVLAGQTWSKISVISYANASGSDLVFHNACALLKITSNTGWDVEIHITADQSLAGTFNLNPSTGALTVTDGKTLVMTTILPDNATVYLAIAPGTYTNFTAAKSNRNDAGKWYSKTKASVTFEKGKIYDLGTTSDWMTQQASAETTDVTWNFSEMASQYNDYPYYGSVSIINDESFVHGDVTLQGSGNLNFDNGTLNTMGSGLTFTAPSGKKFTKIVINATNMPNINDWTNGGDPMNNFTSTWTGDASSVTFSGSANGITSIVFTTAPAETADVTWNFSEMASQYNDYPYYGSVSIGDSESFVHGDVTLSFSGDGNCTLNFMGSGSLNIIGDGTATFTAPDGKKFTSIVITADNVDIYGFDYDMMSRTATWESNSGGETSVSFNGGNASGISTIVFNLADE